MKGLMPRDASVHEAQYITPKNRGEALMRPTANRLRQLEERAGIVCSRCGAPLICALCEQLTGEPARWEFSRLTDAEIEEMERLITKEYGGARWRGN